MSDRDRAELARQARKRAELIRAMGQAQLVLWMDPCCYDHPLCVHMIEALGRKLHPSARGDSDG